MGRSAIHGLCLAFNHIDPFVPLKTMEVCCSVLTDDITGAELGLLSKQSLHVLRPVSQEGRTREFKE